MSVDCNCYSLSATDAKTKLKKTKTRTHVFEWVTFLILKNSIWLLDHRYSYPRHSPLPRKPGVKSPHSVRRYKRKERVRQSPGKTHTQAYIITHGIT